MEKKSKIFVAGHNGMVGSAIFRNLKSKGYSNIIIQNKKLLDLSNEEAVNIFFKYHKPEYVFLAAAKVGGILANSTYPVDFLIQNLKIQTNVISACAENNVKKLLFLGSSCIYPKHTPQPMKEEYLLSGYLEETNKPYALAKIAGIELCRAYNKQYGTNFISVMPCNLYGLSDKYDLKTSHVIPALIRKFHEALLNNHKSVEVWGDGTPKREFMYADDLADACVFLMNQKNTPDLINVGSNEEISIYDLAILIKKIIGFKGEIVFNNNYPNGTMLKKLDTSIMDSFGWKPKINLAKGIKLVYTNYLNFF